jgi:glutathione synthase/RimK-type ligase-like ATP-grasp enzyme
VTCAAVSGKEPEDLRLIDALRTRGITAVHVVWDDDLIDWPSFSLGVVRSTWDYPGRCNHFLACMAQLRRVLNPLPILRWNTNKRYLDDLARRGLPVIPTRFLPPRAVFDPPTWPFVVKPAISCSAKETARYVGGDEENPRAHVRRLHSAGRTVMIQPYLSNIESEGEVALIFIGGSYSHAIRRGAVLKFPGMVHAGESGFQDIRSHAATPEERALAEQVLAAVPLDYGSLLYARVDLVRGPEGKPLILEVELTEPSLFLSFAPGAVERLADGIVRAVENDG